MARLMQVVAFITQVVEAFQLEIFPLLSYIRTKKQL